MKAPFLTFANSKSSRRGGFSLIEVVLAIGIFLVTVLALVGLLGPTLQSVNEVEKTDEVSSVVNTVNAFLQSSPDIAPNASKFDAIYNAVASGTGNYATMFVFRQYVGDSTSIALRVGFLDTDVHPLAQISDFTNAAGSIYRVVLTPSSVLPTPTGNEAVYRSVDRSPTTNTYSLNAALAAYQEGYFAMEVRIFVEDPPGPSGAAFNADKTLLELADIEPIFTYNTAVVR